MARVFWRQRHFFLVGDMRHSEFMAEAVQRYKENTGREWKDEGDQR